MAEVSPLKTSSLAGKKNYQGLSAPEEKTLPRKLLLWPQHTEHTNTQAPESCHLLPGQTRTRDQVSKTLQ